MLAFNLNDNDYVRLLCGSLDQIPSAFAALDREQRDRDLLGLETEPAPDLFAPPTATATASLPKEDRRLVRGKGMQRRILAAANSRAPRTGARRA